MHLAQDDNILELLSEEFALLCELGRRWRITGTFSRARLVQALALVSVIPVKGLIAYRGRLLAAPSEHRVLATERRSTRQTLAGLVHNLSKHLPSDHAELVENENRRVPQAPLSASERFAVLVLDRATESNWHPEGPVDGRGSVF